MEERFGVRLKLLGKTRSGKSTAIYRLVSSLVPLEWSQILVFDGKRDSLRFSEADERVHYFNSTDVAGFADALEIMAARMPDRYAALERSRPTAPTLIIADEIQAATRHHTHKKSVKESLMILAEQSAALGDVMILASQRQQNSIPPGVTANCNASLTMLGLGYFHYKSDGQRAIVGRAGFTTLQEAEAKLRTTGSQQPTASHQLIPADIPDMLGLVHPQPKHGRLTIYTGESGAGLTHALQTHPNGYARHVYVDLAEHSHKTALEAILTQCDAVVPQQTRTGDLAAMAALAMAAEPTLLKLDNLHIAPPAFYHSVDVVLPYAQESAFAFAAPDGSQRREVLDRYAARGQRRELKSLGRDAARQLADAHLAADITGGDRSHAAAHVVREGRGHPGTIVRLAQNIERGELRELRRLEGRKPRGVALGWLVLVGIVTLLMVGRYQTDSYTATLVMMAAYLILRPFVGRSVRDMMDGD